MYPKALVLACWLCASAKVSGELEGTSTYDSCVTMKAYKPSIPAGYERVCVKLRAERIEAVH